MNRQRAFLLLLLGFSGLAALFIVTPFLQYVLAAVIFAYLLYPLNVRLAPRVGERASPVIVIFLALVAVIIPTFYLVVAFLEDLFDLATGETALDIEEIEAFVAETVGLEVDLQGALTASTQELVEILFGNVTGIVSILTQMTIGFALVIFLVYYVLKDGRRFVAWIREATPLPPDVTDTLFDQIDRTTRGVVIGHILVAILQGFLGGIGLYLTGIPNVVFWTVVMIVMALLPLIGAFIVWGPAAVYLVLIDQAGAGMLLAVYGVVIVSTVDNYVRPIIIDQRANLNPGLILVGVFGGVYTLGFTGLFIGPIILGVLAATLVTFKDDYDRL